MVQNHTLSKSIVALRDIKLKNKSRSLPHPFIFNTNDEVQDTLHNIYDNEFYA